MASLNKNEENNLNDSIMILTIDIGDGICDKLRIHNITKFEEETYDFCAKNNLDFHTMQEINNQIQKVIKENKIITNVVEPKNNKKKFNFQKRKSKEEKKNNKIENTNKINNMNNINNINKKRNIPNKKTINRYNANPLSLITKRQKDSYKNNNFFNNNTRPSTSSSKGSFIAYNNKNIKKNDNIMTNVKNAFNIIKNKSKQNSSSTSNASKNIISRENINSSNNTNNTNNIKTMNNDIKNLVEYSSNENEYLNNYYNNNNENIEIKERLIYNLEEDKKIISNFKEEKNDYNNHNICNKKRKESIELINPEGINDDNYHINEKEKEKNVSQIYRNNNNQLLLNDKNNTYNIMNNNNISMNDNINNFYIEDEKNKRNKNRAQSERIPFKGIYQESNKKKEKNSHNSLNNNNISNNMNNKKKRNYEYAYSNEDIIKNYKKYKEEKYKSLKEKQEKEFKKIYTFRPTINKSTKILFNECKSDYSNNNNDKNKDKGNKRSKSLGRFEKLYNDRISLKENQNKLIEEIDKKYSYKPKLNKNSLFLMNKKSFNERLKMYTNRAKEKMSKIQMDLENNRKKNEYFQPKLNLNRNKELLKEREEITNQYGKYNKQYLYSKKYEQKKQYLTEKYFEEQCKSPECCPMTNNIYNQKKEKCFKKIFRLLDGDNDGKISYNCISIKHLPEILQNILEPIFLELKVENEVLNETEFIFVCEQFFNVLKYDQKQKILSFEDEEKRRIKKEKIEKENTNYSFRPKINKCIDLYYHNLNRVSSYESNKNIINYINYNSNRRKSVDAKELNYLTKKEENFRRFNNNNYNKGMNNIIVSNISLCNLINKKNENEKNFDIISFKDDKNITNNNNNLIIQNLNNRIDKGICYRNIKGEINSK